MYLIVILWYSPVFILGFIAYFDSLIRFYGPGFQVKLEMNRFIKHLLGCWEGDQEHGTRRHLDGMSESPKLFQIPNEGNKV
jgi:hypothetical protein